mmetsp:Transcript_58331/g.126093  ORF Transcript_58331/g.126093 Transcript_58331/m.126093 type:complete len:201 (-) Transcript_58331:40-642(-)
MAPVDVPFRAEGGTLNTMVVLKEIVASPDPEALHVRNKIFIRVGSVDVNVVANLCVVHARLCLMHSLPPRPQKHSLLPKHRSGHGIEEVALWSSGYIAVGEVRKYREVRVAFGSKGIAQGLTKTIHPRWVGCLHVRVDPHVIDLQVLVLISELIGNEEKNDDEQQKVVEQGDFVAPVDNFLGRFISPKIHGRENTTMLPT